jgi:TatD DNase family protein
VQIAEAGYYLSIPSAVANTDPNSSFKRLAAVMPLSQLLTETDSPYMGPVRGVDNTPDTVIQSIETIAKMRGMEADELRDIVRDNFRRLFSL